ncbi:hypothetical protein RJ80_gp13 [Vibrio phage phi-A318]|uniref:Uncharacterized protein n=1 Tax=Vibrio phage phi-A318 TaxID=1151014 RepID=A0A067YAT9_9CAUD|nr:hypothetical protein RJ80_gp13 [Vibrio phage phi-A318]AGZ17786.1 hypothetical protein [Vibrio phage phi-A318]
MYKVVKVLLAAKECISNLAERVRTYAINKQVTRMELAAERIDVEDELYLKRLETAEVLKKMLEDRAADKLDEGHERANAAKEAAGKAIEELNKL